MARVLLCDNPEGGKPTLDIALSERNLIILLTKLHTPRSRCSFQNGDVPGEFAYATFRAEPDEFHYSSPTRDGGPPGPMHPLSELVHQIVSDILDGADIGNGTAAAERRTT